MRLRLYSYDPFLSVSQTTSLDLKTVMFPKDFTKLKESLHGRLKRNTIGSFSNN